MASSVTVLPRDFIVPGHPVGDYIPDVGAVIGPVFLLASIGYSESATKIFGYTCEYFMRICEHAGVRLSPLGTHITVGKFEKSHGTFLKASRKFRVEAIDPSRFLRNWHRDNITAAIAELESASTTVTDDPIPTRSARMNQNLPDEEQR